MCLHGAWQVSSVCACVHVRASTHWSTVPSVLQGRGLFPGNWLVQKPGRSSQQWGGNTRPVTLLVISGDKAEKRWDNLSARLPVCVCVSVRACVHVHVGVHIRVSGTRAYHSSRRGWQYWTFILSGLLFPSLSPLGCHHAFTGLAGSSGLWASSALPCWLSRKFPKKKICVRYYNKWWEGRGNIYFERQ